MILSQEHITILKTLLEECPLGENTPYDFSRLLKKLPFDQEDANFSFLELHSMGYIDYTPFNSSKFGRITLFPSAVEAIKEL